MRFTTLAALALATLGSSPALASPSDALEAMTPRTTRAGTLRFVDDALDDAAAPGWLLGRLEAGDGAPAVRAAWADALVRSLGFLAADGQSVRLAGLGAVALADADPQVRATLLSAVTDAATLRAALADTDGVVRAAAVAGLTRASDADALTGRLTDADPEVRVLAVRGLGWLQVGFDDVVPLLADADRDVRLQAVRALQRIDAARAVDAVAPLADDPDAHVRHLVGASR